LLNQRAAAFAKRTEMGRAGRHLGQIKRFQAELQ
jgi:hypothetical protein